MIEDAIRKLAGTHSTDKISISEVTVKSVNEDDRTCDGVCISGKSEVEIVNIRLMASIDDGFLITPKTDSTIIVAHSTNILPFILQFSEIEKVLIITGDTTIEIKDGLVKYNDGTFNGFVKIDDLTSKLNEKINLINAELVKIQTGIAAAGGTYSPSSITTFNKSDYENTKITHGK